MHHPQPQPNLLELSGPPSKAQRNLSVIQHGESAGKRPRNYEEVAQERNKKARLPTSEGDRATTKWRSHGPSYNRMGRSPPRPSRDDISPVSDRVPSRGVVPSRGHMRSERTHKGTGTEKVSVPPRTLPRLTEWEMKFQRGGSPPSAEELAELEETKAYLNETENQSQKQKEPGHTPGAHGQVRKLAIEDVTTSEASKPIEAMSELDEHQGWLMRGGRDAASPEEMAQVKDIMRKAKEMHEAKRAAREKKAGEKS